MNRLPWLFAALAIVALVWAFSLQLKLHDCQSWKEMIAQFGADQRQQNISLRAQLALIKDRDTKEFILSDGGNAKLGASCYYNPIRQETAIDLGGVPAPASVDQKNYCWALIEKKYVLLGELPRYATGSWAPVKFVPNAEGFVISAEKTIEGRDVPSTIILTSFQ